MNDANGKPTPLEACQAIVVAFSGKAIPLLPQLREAIDKCFAAVSAFTPIVVEPIEKWTLHVTRADRYVVKDADGIPVSHGNSAREAVLRALRFAATEKRAVEIVEA